MRNFLRDGRLFSEGKKAMSAALAALSPDRRAIVNQHGYQAVWAELYFNELREILEANFGAFQRRIGEDKSTVITWMKHVNECRSDAHAKRLGSDDLAYLRVCFKRLEEMLGLD
jgi:hypothetical protein